MGGFWLQKAHAGQTRSVPGPLEEISAQLELGHDRRGEVDPDRVKLGERDRLIAGLA